MSYKELQTYSDEMLLDMDTDRFDQYYENIRMTITQYNSTTDGEIQTYTGGCEEILRQIPDYKSRYYRLTYFGKDLSNTRIKTDYMGCRQIQTYGSFNYSESVQLNRCLNSVIQSYDIDGEQGTSSWTKFRFLSQRAFKS